ncbi:MAG: NAD(P)/FAD-dependent oxidoreductase [Candidatus Krumholzibacteriota bacterium]|nr:NAD(P)/FAD-dependent oxidoreductase [Candidatus Krumholzibacteriota bacterium]
MQHRVDVAVVGAGPAGCAAAAQCARLGLEARLLDASGRAGGLVANAFRVENYPGLPPLDGPSLAARLAEHLERFGLAVTPGRVERLRADGDGFELGGDFGTWRAGGLVLATGTRPRLLSVPGAAELEGRALFYEPCDLLAARPAPRAVLVVGGGEAALDYALTVAAAGARVTVCLRGEAPRACRRLGDLAAAEERITLRAGVTVRALAAAPGGVDATLTREGGGKETLAVDAVLAAIGRRATASDLLAPLGLAAGGTVATGHPRLFVAGDARLGSLGQVAMAAGDGLAAAAGLAAALAP